MVAHADHGGVFLVPVAAFATLGARGRGRTFASGLGRARRMAPAILSAIRLAILLGPFAAFVLAVFATILTTVLAVGAGLGLCRGGFDRDNDRLLRGQGRHRGLLPMRLDRAFAPVFAFAGLRRRA